MLTKKLRGKPSPSLSITASTSGATKMRSSYFVIRITLTPLFLELLNDACARQPLVLMFDVFERTCETLSPWLLALFDFEYGEFTTR